jgi:hypothetical protein
MNEQTSLTQFDAQALDETALCAVTGGFHRFGGRRFDIDFNVDIDVEINIVNIRGNGNVVAGRDANLFRRR